jgi:hypothetical protein
MKVTVSRALQNGVYHVKFAVTDFSADELAKMKSFGVPIIKMKWGGVTSSMSAAGVPMTAIGVQYDAGFGTEEEAKAYEQDILVQLRAALQYLREKKDDFSSAEEVTF